MELYQLRHFVAILETGSFTKGAERCAVSQPAISASVARLEAEVGAQLIVRQKKQISPTSAGRTLFQTAVDVLRACSAVKIELKNRDRKTTLRIGVVETMPANLVSSLVKAFRRQREGLRIEILDDGEQNLRTRLSEGRIDVSLTILHPDEKHDDTSRSRALFTERYVLLVPNGHPLASNSVVRLKDISGQAFITRTRCETFSETTKLFGSLGVRPVVVYRTDQDARALELIGSGIGIALMPSSYASDDTTPLPVEDFPLKRTIGLKWGIANQKEELAEFLKFAASHAWPKSSYKSTPRHSKR
jgi:DNA-binding transcriptional LysR family regulator